MTEILAFFISRVGAVVSGLSGWMLAPNVSFIGILIAVIVLGFLIKNFLLTAR